MQVFELFGGGFVEGGVFGGCDEIGKFFVCFDVFFG